MNLMNFANTNETMSNISEKIIDYGQKTIEREINGLESLKDSLDSNFVAVVDLVYKLKGRLILSGMGKSGHIAKKIAATLASTGTPSFFVHPGEASHGDLGMITEDDAVFLLSNSGETKELEDIIGYCKRFSIPVIGLARRASSMLIESANIGIALPEIPEQSLTGAPTTSTTMMLAYGDAVAMALLEFRGFSKEDFGVFHPGGKLGSGLIRVNKLMHSGDAIPIVTENCDMKEVLLEITAKTFGCAGVIDNNGNLSGVITDGDIRRHLENPDLLSTLAKDNMTKNPLTTSANTLAVEALSIMNEKNITCVFVTEGNKPVGIMHIHDCLRAGL